MVERPTGGGKSITDELREPPQTIPGSGPVNRQSMTDPFGDSKPQKTVNKTVTEYNTPYKCPNCEGEFPKWDTVTKEVPAGHVHTEKQRKACPFCGLEKGEYDPDD